LKKEENIHKHLKKEIKDESIRYGFFGYGDMVYDT
jgi:hypothetical protein